MSVRHSTEHSRRLAGGVLSPNHSSGPPRPWGWPIYSQFAPAFPTPSRGRRERPARCSKGSAGSSARTQHQYCPGVCLPPGADAGVPLGNRPNLSRRPALAPPPKALRTWSWPKARSTAVTPASPAGISVSATDEILPRARGVPDPWKSWSDRPPREGVTIRSQEREPGPPLGPAVRRHQLHPRSGARPRLPRVGEERKK